MDKFEQLMESRLSRLEGQKAVIEMRLTNDRENEKLLNRLGEIHSLIEQAQEILDEYRKTKENP